MPALARLYQRLSRAPSTQARGLAAFADFTIDLAIVIGFAVFAVDRYAPPQDLPWKPFSLNEPLGLATAMKLDRVRDDPAACRKALADGDVAFQPAETRTQGYCSTANSLRLADEGLAPRGPTMTCPLALTYALWERQVVQPAAEALLDARASAVDHYGTYACRNIYGRPDGSGARPSRHATAEALDVAGFRLSDGRRLTIARNFRDENAGGRFLRVARAGACRLFGATLSPDYNAAHADHLHLDMSTYQLCR